ncbi:transposase [uncultured Eubacterium sp.]|uniref:transposase n=1 Tax=uncultured Eubacterium sp. TaxID=165185 RepID=UPI0025E61AA3|nr:transposase [uncultured Eubacterium sp.]
MNNIELPKRKANRLPNYDYSQNGAYFITICVKDKEPILSKIEFNSIYPNEIRLSKFGIIVANEILNIEKRFDNTKVLDYVIMPNHIHLIIQLDDCSCSLGQIIGSFKSIATLQSKKIGYSNDKLFQRNYYDHIIRNEDDYLTKSNYIKNNPEKWLDDKYYKS